MDCEATLVVLDESGAPACAEHSLVDVQLLGQGCPTAAGVERDPILEKKLHEDQMCISGPRPVVTDCYPRSRNMKPRNQKVPDEKPCRRTSTLSTRALPNTPQRQHPRCQRSS